MAVNVSFVVGNVSGNGSEFEVWLAGCQNNPQRRHVKATEPPTIEQHRCFYAGLSSILQNFIGNGHKTNIFTDERKVLRGMIEDISWTSNSSNVSMVKGCDRIHRLLTVPMPPISRMRRLILPLCYSPNLDAILIINMKTHSEMPSRK